AGGREPGRHAARGAGRLLRHGRDRDPAQEAPGRDRLRGLRDRRASRRVPARVHPHRCGAPRARPELERARGRGSDAALEHQVLHRVRDAGAGRAHPQPVRDHPRELPRDDLMAGGRNVLVMSLAVFALIAGEQLWTRFLPVYLVALGAPAVALGVFGSSKDFIDAALQYPRGAVSDRYGSQRALLLFTAIPGLGYLAYWMAPSWPFMFLGLLL